MREEFHGELHQLGEQLASMCRRAGEAMEGAMRGLVDIDLVAAERVISDVDVIRIAAQDCDERACHLLALQSPVARDLRVVVSAIRAAERIGRMGQLACHVAEIVRRRHPESAVPAALIERFVTMGQHAVLVAHSTELAISDPTTTRAEELNKADDHIDALQRELLEEVIRPESGYSVQDGVDVSLLARFIERFADQAVGVTRQLDFVVTGDYPGRVS